MKDKLIFLSERAIAEHWHFWEYRYGFRWWNKALENTAKAGFRDYEVNVDLYADEFKMLPYAEKYNDFQKTMQRLRDEGLEVLVTQEETTKFHVIVKW